MEKVENLEKQGVEKILAIIISWYDLTREEKNELSFKTLYFVWRECIELKKKTELWELIAKKIENFSHCQWLLKHEGENPSQEILLLAISRAKDFSDWLWLYEKDVKHEKFCQLIKSSLIKSAKEVDEWEIVYRLSENLQERKKILKEFSQIVETFLQLKWLWEKYSHEERNLEFFNRLKKAAENFDHCKWLYNVSIFDPKEKNACFKLLKSKAESFDDWLYIWIKAPNERERSVAWENVLFKIDSIKHCQKAWNSIPIGTKEEVDLWNKAKKIADNFDDFIWLWLITSGNSHKFAEVLELIYKKAETLDEWLWVWRNAGRNIKIKKLAWENVKKLAITFSDWRSVVEKVSYGTEEELEAWMKTVEVAVNIKQWNFILNYKPNHLFLENSVFFDSLKNKVIDFEWAKKLWHTVSSESKKKSEAWYLMLSKIENFSQAKQLFNLAKYDSEEKLALWEVAKEKAESLEECCLLLTKAKSVPIFAGDLWFKIKSQIKTFKDCKIAYSYVLNDEKRKEECLELAERKAKTILDWQWIWLRSDCESDLKKNALTVITKLTESV